MLYGYLFNFFRSFGCKAVFPIIAYRLIDDRSTIDTFPGIEHQEKVRESFQHHQSFALRTIHDSSLLLSKLTDEEREKQFVIQDRNH
jgi:hypothetical protein